VTEMTDGLGGADDGEIGLRCQLIVPPMPSQVNKCRSEYNLNSGTETFCHL